MVSAMRNTLRDKTALMTVPSSVAENVEETKDRRGIQSIEVGGQLLLALGRTGKPMVLKELALEAGMPAAKAHPYLVSFARLGLIEQDLLTGRYELGPQLLQLGLISLQRLKPVRIATKEIATLSMDIGHTVAIAVWGDMGPTIIWVHESSHALHINVRTGTVMSLLNTATGLVFAAFLPPKVVEGMIRTEVDRLGGLPDPPSRKKIEALLAEVRHRGLARIAGALVSGINAVSAPVFDHAGNIILAITAIGPSGVFDPDWNSPIARRVVETADRISRLVGDNP
jgi:DNA-binding IclR family transcriptional regulator